MLQELNRCQRVAHVHLWPMTSGPLTSQVCILGSTCSWTSAPGQRSDAAHSVKGFLPSAGLPQPHPEISHLGFLPPWSASSISAGFRSLESCSLSISGLSAKLSIRSKRAPGSFKQQDCSGSVLVSWSISFSPKHLFNQRVELAAPLGIFSPLGEVTPNASVGTGTALFGISGLISEPTGRQEPQDKHRRAGHLPSEAGPLP